jgi:hypothetical protein
VTDVVNSAWFWIVIAGIITAGILVLALVVIAIVAIVQDSKRKASQRAIEVIQSPVIANRGVPRAVEMTNPYSDAGAVGAKKVSYTGDVSVNFVDLANPLHGRPTSQLELLSPSSVPPPPPLQSGC